MYQVLSFKDDVEYIITDEDYSVQNYYDTKNLENEKEYRFKRSIFQTLLEFLNTDYESKAVNEFIELVCECSKNKYMLNRKAENLTEYHLCNYLFHVFPKEENKKSIYTIKSHRRKGMTINKEFDTKCIAYIKEEHERKNRHKISWCIDLRAYIDKMNEIDLLRNPLYFALYVKEKIIPNVNITPDTIQITHAVPYVPMLAIDNLNIDKFVDLINKNCLDDKYDEFLLHTVDDTWGHGKPFEYDYHNIGELNIVISDIYFILQQGWIIKKCPNCGKYFVNRDRSDVKYCSNPSPLDSKKTCGEYAKTRGYYLKRQSDEVENLRTKIKDRLRRRANRAENDNGAANDNNNQFKKYDKDFRDNLKKGSNTSSNYYDWLKRVDEQTKKGGGKIPKPSM